MVVVKVIELIGVSEKSWEDAASEVLKEASKTIKGISGLDIVGQKAVVKNDKIVSYKVVAKVAFPVLRGKVSD